MNKEIQISPFGSLLVYREGYTPEFVFDTIRRHNLRGLRIFVQLREDKLPNIDFLSNYLFLEVLDITSVDDYDFRVLSSLVNLKELTISIDGKNEIFLDNQTNLESLSIKWRKGKIKSIERCLKLKTLCLVDFNEDDFFPISRLKNLKDLKVKTSSIKTTNGLKNLVYLENILLANCKALISIEGIGGKNYLTTFSIDLCPKIGDYENLKDLPNIETFQITNCRGIKSIKFIKNFPSLTKLTLLGNTDVLDGDMTPAQGIKDVMYMHRKHYNIKIENKEYDDIIKQNMEKIRNNDHK